MSRYFLFFLAIAGLILGGCHAPRIHDLAIADYAFAARHHWILSKHAAATDAMNRMIYAQVASDFAVRGYEEVHDRNKADWEIDWVMSETLKHRHTAAGGGWGSAGLDRPGQHAVTAPVHDAAHALPPSVDPYSPDYETADFRMKITSIPDGAILWEIAAEDDGDFGYFPNAQYEAIHALVPELLKTLP